jgi:hypothetical protein
MPPSTRHATHLDEHDLLMRLLRPFRMPAAKDQEAFAVYLARISDLPASNLKDDLMRAAQAREARVLASHPTCP